VKIVRTLVEYAASQVNRPFDYLANDEVDVKKGVRVNINFNNKIIVGYVLDVIDTDKGKEELDEEYGFDLKFIDSVIDEKSLINEEIDSIVGYLSKETSSINQMLSNCFTTLFEASII